MEEGIMDEKRAMKILGLEKGFSRGDVKIAYRTLAKAFHPDRYGYDDGSGRAAEARMVDINLAASVLIAAAPDKEEPEKREPEKKTVRKSSRSGPGWFARLFRSLARRRPRPAVRAGRPRPAPSPRRTPKRAGFSEVFENCMGKETVAGKKSVKRGKPRKQVDYGTYLAMKRRMKRRPRPMDAGRVQPVSPVTPVSKINN
ncbi:MAG: J domain-containing protein [Desulfobacteraceae bacterium]|nr:J domain-containing protein [Desulfobacteraceae bacterium]